MELFNRGSADRVQRGIAEDARGLVESVIAKGETYGDLAKQTYLMGATSLPILLAGHYQVTHRLGLAKADDWLAEHLRALGKMLSDDANRTVTISVTLSPKTPAP